MDRSALRFFCALLLAPALIWPGDRSHALEVRCIEASKYKHIRKLFSDDDKFAEFLQVDKKDLPSPETCRAVIVSGMIGNTREIVENLGAVPKDVPKLVRAIEQNKGWLAEIYLRSGGGSAHGGMVLGEIVRMFWLKTTAIGARIKMYEPDFINIRFNGREQVAKPQENASHELSRQAYDKATRSSRSVHEGDEMNVCASACSMLYVAGIERKGSVRVHRSRILPGKPKLDSDTHFISGKEVLEFDRPYLVHMDGGLDLLKKTETTPPQQTSPAESARYPREILESAPMCGPAPPRIDQEKEAIRLQLKKAVRNSPDAARLDSELREAETRQATAELCLARSIERNRLRKFAEHCPGNTCSAEALGARAQFNLFLAIAVAGNRVGQTLVGQMLVAGYGAEKDLSEAIKWFRKAADQGEDQAQFALGVIYEHGEGVTPDPVEAEKWYRLAAEKGHVPAQNNLGVFYSKEGPRQNYTECLKWLRKAAASGSANAMNNIGALYSAGDGVPQNYSEAMKWFRKASQRKNPTADFNIGILYFHGQGVPQNFKEAARWFRIAADSEVGKAQIMLAAMYEDGVGVPASNVQALKWYLIVGNDQEFGNLARERATLLISSMPRGEVEEAERLAREWSARRSAPLSGKRSTSGPEARLQTYRQATTIAIPLRH